MKSEAKIDDKRFIILPNDKSLKIKVVPNLNTKSLLTIDVAEAYSIGLINKWANEKWQSNRK